VRAALLAALAAPAALVVAAAAPAVWPVIPALGLTLLALVLFDFAPVAAVARKLPAIARQPGFGLLGGVLVAAVVAVLWTGFVAVGGMDMVLFMVRVCVTINFGCFILLVMFEGMPGFKLAQPWRGIVLCAVAALLAGLMLAIYQAVAVGRFNLPSGGPGYAMELWLASSMLAVSFPAMVAFAGYFQFWPLASPGRNEA